ncbi:hypothetical protein H8S90_24900 [Olivibacter sp. SDN3]|uniref:hypothetical protein n=1 Tax=Olivibacter sp. SDN3 TaxID=2764720 RepID=UPI0016510FCC|nr:hypothetical protein [Olivibacter sp. SDN3]QNL49893.1 hypothetical protein H8S90_24900 [Olivibacter sp. SDN3]
MMKWLVRLLSFCIFLLVGGNQLLIHPYQDARNYSKQQTERLTHTSFGSVGGKSLTVTKADPFGLPHVHDNLAIEDSEDKDDDWFSLRKPSLICKYFNIFYAQALNQLCLYFRKSLPSCEHFSYFSSHTYLLFRVIKI